MGILQSEQKTRMFIHKGNERKFIAFENSDHLELSNCAKMPCHIMFERPYAYA